MPAERKTEVGRSTSVDVALNDRLIGDRVIVPAQLGRSGQRRILSQQSKGLIASSVPRGIRVNGSEVDLVDARLKVGDGLAEVGQRAVADVGDRGEDKRVVALTASQFVDASSTRNRIIASAAADRVGSGSA